MRPPGDIQTDPGAPSQLDGRGGAINALVAFLLTVADEIGPLPPAEFKFSARSNREVAAIAITTTRKEKAAPVGDAAFCSGDRD